MPALAKDLDWGPEEVGSGGVLRIQVEERPRRIQEPSTSALLHVATAAVVLGLTAGSGGIWRADGLDVKSIRVEPSEAREAHTPKMAQKHVASPIIKQLMDVQETFGLNISELAEALHVQRPTIYQWHKGARLRPKNARRLGQLHGIAETVRQLGLSESVRLLHIAPQGRESLFSLLQSKAPDTDAVIAAMTWGVDLRDRQRVVRNRLSAVAAGHGFEDVSQEEQESNTQQISSEIS